MGLHYQKLFDQFDCESDDAHNGTVPTWVWATGHRLLTPWIPDRVNFAFNDPVSFSDTPVNQQVYTALLENLINPDGITENGLVKLVEKFSLSCTMNEWKNFYQPVLQRKTDHGLLMGNFNHYVYDTKWKVTPIDRIKPIIGNPQENGYFYAYNDSWSDVYIVIFKDHAEVVDHDFATVPYDDVAEAFTSLCGHDAISYPLVIETITEGYELYLMDIVEIDKVNIWPTKFRREILEQCFMKVMETYEGSMIALGDGFYGGDKDLSTIIDEYNNMGYSNMPMLLFKPESKPYNHPPLMVPTISLT